MLQIAFKDLSVAAAACVGALTATYLEGQGGVCRYHNDWLFRRPNGAMIRSFKKLRACCASGDSAGNGERR